MAMGKLNSLRRRSTCYAAAPSALSTLVLLFLLATLLYFLHSIQSFRRRLYVHSRTSGSLSFNPAVVTMSDQTFQYCMLQLVRSIRRLGWKHTIFLLAIDYDQFDPIVARELDIHGVFIVHTNSIFDRWLVKEAEGSHFRSLDASKFRKMELFVNPIFRAFDRLIYMDADGIVSSDLSPLLQVPFKHNETLLMRQNDRSVRKDSLWTNEISIESLNLERQEDLALQFPDRDISGASCWFIVNTPKLPSPVSILERSFEILCQYRAAFKLNDQTLLNLLFYDSISMFPWCSWDEVIVENDPTILAQYCQRHMHLQRWLEGNIAFIYRHMSVQEKEVCVAEATRRKKLGTLILATSRKNEQDSDDISKETNCTRSLHMWKQSTSL